MPDQEAIDPLSFDDLKPRRQFELGTYEMTRAEVIDFASRYDPQPFHLDDAAAAANPVFGRLSASGWHTAMVMHLLWDRFSGVHGLRAVAGVGVDEIRWLRPVYPDDRLAGMMKVVRARRSASKPDRGIATVRITLRNQHGEQVAAMVATALYEV
jgi:acyl dehydratase